MRALHPDLWVTESPLRFFGLEVGARTTVVRLRESKLLVHSPIAASEELLRDVRKLGAVEYIVAPNRLHHLFVGEWQTAFPEASLYVAPGLDSKRADLRIAGILGDEAEAGWRHEVDQIAVRGFPFANEVVFFHRPSATLIASDLAYNVGPKSPVTTRMMFRLVGGYGQVAPSILERLLVRDRDAFRRSLEKILEWPFERIVIAHGEVSETGGREEFVRGYSWLLDR